ncbi:probable ATP-dependent RNA helicase DDX52, partial [Diaphorina citri]|uniref:RNA helicase n=1 Tax=Diaphorina citri TaxID=121845 RepID=A0A1S3CY72_DIACI
MDAQDIFRKLSVGCSFKRKRPEFIPGFVKSDPEKPAFHVNDPSQLKKQIKSEEEVKEEVESENEEKPEMQDAEEIQPAKKKKKKEFSEEKKKLLEEEQINHLRKLHRITVKGKNVVKPIESFAELSSDYKVSDKLVTNIEKAGYTTPTPIQMQTIPAMLQGRQIFACAPTGSGKTAAFLIPIIHSLRGPKNLGFRAVIVCPTRELAKQTYNETVRLSEGLGLRAHVIGKIQQAAEKFGPRSAQKFDVLITTPNKLVYLLQMDPPALNLAKQFLRDNVVRSFRTGRIWILITTELLGRGIDFRTVRLVVNYDFPSSAISYIHRIGRAGRGGREGKAVTFFTKQDAPLLR